MISSLCLFGDSVARGVVYDESKRRYTFLKNSAANIISRVCGITVDNYSKFGCTLTKGRKIIERHLPGLRNYDYVALEFGGNDCNFNWAEISETPDEQHFPATPIDEFTDEYLNVVSDIKASGAKPVIFNLPPIDSKKFFRWIARGNNPENILKWLGDVDEIYRWHDGYNSAVGAVAESTATTLIDIRSVFLKAGDYGGLMCEDGMHPNALGQFLMAREIQKYIA